MRVKNPLVSHQTKKEKDIFMGEFSKTYKREGHVEKFHKIKKKVLVNSNSMYYNINGQTILGKGSVLAFGGWFKL